jgi:hypothetical protein
MAHVEMVICLDGELGLERGLACWKVSSTTEFGFLERREALLLNVRRT